jgi:thiol-disulfide isomerase/thioredoxin
MKRWTLPALLLLALILAACGATGTEETAVAESDDAMMAEEDATMEESEHMDDDVMDDTADDAMAESMDDAWRTLPLTDARTGETFTLADFSGQTVFVEPMATWCTNCRRQLMNVDDARATLAGEDVVFIALSLETDLPDADLAGYAAGLGFDWTFAVMSQELLQALADAFGRSITSAPSTPHFIIRPDGSTTDLVTGIDSPTELIEMIRAAQG